MGNTVQQKGLPFGANSEAQEVADFFKDRAAKKTFLITGAGAGLGWETARSLASIGANVILAARSQSAADDAVNRVRAALGPSGASADLSGLAIDLSSIASIEKGAAEFLSKTPKLHVLINNAGVMASPLSVTSDGLEMQFGVNHVGHQHLTTLLLPALKAAGTAAEPARVVNVSSMGNFIFGLPKGIEFDNLPPNPKTYNAWTRYSESKLSNILMSREVTKRCAAAGAHVFGVALHPGVMMNTSLNRHLDFGNLWTMTCAALWRRNFAIFTQKSKTIPQGAATQVLMALDPSVSPNSYYADCQPTKSLIHALAGSDELAGELWLYTEDLVAKIKSDKTKAVETYNS